MPLVDMRDMLNHAYRNRYAVGGFSATGLEFLRVIVAAAERCRSPVILNFDGARLDDDVLDPLVAAAERVAQRASVPVALHFERGRSLAAAARAINLGCNGVMVRIPHESFPGMVADVRRAVEMAHACGVTVEGELGNPEAADAAEAAGVSVEEARAFVHRTGVDCLALPVCRPNGRARGRAKPDADRWRRLNEALQTPLVIQAGGGLADEHYYRLIQHGVAKINCDRSFGEADRESVGAQAERRMQLWGSAGRAAEVLVQCRAWRPVQHVIVYNVEGADDAQVEAMMASGREVLGRIPGVRRVFTGWALQKGAKFRCCWLVEFVHEKVVDSYRDHPDHVAFANQLFRPIAGERISIDFAGTRSPAGAGAADNGVDAVVRPAAAASGR